MSDFYDLVRQAELDPTNTDFAALRLAYVQSDTYRPLKHISQTRLMQITNNAANFTEVATICQNILQANPLDLEARMMLATAQEQLGDPAAERTHAFAESLLDAILASGDGKSLESPFKLVSALEAWTVLRVFGIKASTQTREQLGDRVYDVFMGKLDETNVTVYFDITLTVPVLRTTLDTGTEETP